MPQNLIGRAKLLHVNLLWEGSTGATHFLVFRRLNSQSNFVEVGQTAQRAFIDDLPNGTLLAEYFVVAENAFGMSGDSTIVPVIPASRGR